MNMHILSFEPGAMRLYRNARPEHGAYILSGQGVYSLDNPVDPGEKATTSLWELIPCRPDTAWVVAKHSATSIPKIANRDVEI